jgi:outer membrane protein assembly factor BamB
MNWRGLAICALIPVALFWAGCAKPTEDVTVGEWRQFRGPEGLGISAEENLPVHWQESSPHIRWQADVPGRGNSSPVVSRGRVFLTAVAEGVGDDQSPADEPIWPRRIVLAYDLESGEQLWETTLFDGPTGKIHWSNTHAAPTPVTDGRHVFVSFDAHLAALDFDGNVVWHHEVDRDYFEDPRYGASSSPVLADDAVILLQDKEEGESEYPGWIAAFDKRTGKQIWRDEWSHTCCSYNTPLVVERDGRLEVWNQTAMEVIGYDAHTGERLWRGVHGTMQTVPSMVRQDDIFLTPGGIHHRSLVMFHLCQTGDDIEPIPIWSGITGSPEIASPVLYRDRLFSVSSGGALYVFDARTGKEVWKKRLPSGMYRSSLVAGDGKVYVANSTGVTTVIDATSERPRILSRNSLPSGSTASPAIVDGTILLRGQGQLFRIGQGQSADSAVEPEAELQAEAAKVAA